MEKEIIGKQVKKFYEFLPFNYHKSTDELLKQIQVSNPIRYYTNVHKLLSENSQKNILDVGCGIGWFTNSVVYYYNAEALGIDFCHTALIRAKEVSEKINISERVKFICGDLFNLPIKQKFFLVNSLGVLHHTYDCRRALESISKLVDSKGYLNLGLYHKYGRLPFLDMFKEYLKDKKDLNNITIDEVKESFELYKRLNSQIKDETFLKSWFRDQVLHPHETQHTFKEVCQWLTELNFQVINTSINNFEQIKNIKDLFIEEKKFYEISIQKNIKEKKYFPGFFTVLARSLN